MKTEPINLFWTGGWDSTFRLLYILLIEKKYVQPYYIIDSSRNSTMHELKAMNTIKKEVVNKFPETKKLILNCIISLKNDILPNSELNKYYNNIRCYLDIGSQYEWLACFANQFGIDDFELCLAKPDSKSNIENSYKSLLFPELEGKMHDCRLHNEINNENVLLFRYFRFPVVHLRKIDMKSLSLEYNFHDILCRTWFCHRFTSRGRPCGVCKPCSFRMNTGVETQIPFSKTRFVKQIWLPLKDELRKIEPVKELWYKFK